MSVAETQDLADIVNHHISRHQDITSIAERFHVNPTDTFPEEGSRSSDRVRALIRTINGTDKLIELVSYVLNNEMSSESPDIEEIEQIFAPYGYTVDSSDGITIVPTAQPPIQELQEEERTWIEENAPEKTIDNLQSAREHLSNGRWSNSIHECPLALESLTTTGSFSGSLQELHQKNVILKGTNDRKKDYRLLKTLYHYCSTMGSHTSGSTQADQERAGLSLLMVESAVYFILKQIKKATESRSLPINQWK